jgi:hypothetical protein
MLLDFYGALGPVVCPVGVSAEEWSVVGAAASAPGLAPLADISAEALGLSVAAAKLIPYGAETAEALGVATEAAALLPFGVPSGETAGQSKITCGLATYGIASSEALYGSLLGPYLLPFGTPSGEGLGAALFSTSISAYGIDSYESMGAGSLGASPLVLLTFAENQFVIGAYMTGAGHHHLWYLPQIAAFTAPEPASLQLIAGDNIVTVPSGFGILGCWVQAPQGSQNPKALKGHAGDAGFASTFGGVIGCTSGGTFVVTSTGGEEVFLVWF